MCLWPVSHATQLTSFGEPLAGEGVFQTKNLLGWYSLFATFTSLMTLLRRALYLCWSVWLRLGLSAAFGVFDPGTHSKKLLWTSMYGHGGEVVMSLGDDLEVIIPLLCKVVYHHYLDPRVACQPLPKPPYRSDRRGAKGLEDHFTHRETVGDGDHRTEM